MRSRPWIRGERAVLVALWSVACQGDPVPFKQPQPGPEQGADALQSGAPSQKPAAEEDPQSFVPQSAELLPSGTVETALGGLAVLLPEHVREQGGSLRAVLGLDFDQDGDQDALAVVEGPGRVVLYRATNQDGGLTVLQPTETQQTLGQDCRLREAPMRQLAPEFVAIEVHTECHRLEQPAHGPAVPRTSASHETWVLTADEAPALLERLQVSEREEPGERESALSYQLAVADHDQDGHPDLITELALEASAELERIGLKLVWLNRPGGLARERTEPDSTLRALANRAHAELRRRRTTQALHAAELALDLHQALCRESGAARFRVGDVLGVECGVSSAMGRAVAVRVAALAREGRLLEALEAAEQLGAPGFRVLARDRKLAAAGLDKLTVEHPITQRLPITHRAPSAPEVRLPALAFVDEHTLLLRGRKPWLYNLERGERLPAPLAQGHVLIRDPQQRFAVTGVERSCQGYRLRVEALSLVHDRFSGAVQPGYVAGASGLTPSGRIVSRPLLKAHAPPQGVDCRALPPAQRRDAGGYRVLGWTERGVIAVRGSELRLVPLDPNTAQPSGRSRALGAGAPLPSPLPPGQVTTDGTQYVWPSARGLVIRRLSPRSHSRLLVPEQWRPGDADATELALSPGGRKVAVLRRGRVVVWRLPPAPAADDPAGTRPTTLSNATPVDPPRR